MRDSGERFAGFLQPDQDAPEAIAANEIARAIDRVDDPAAAAGSGLARSLFAQDAVAGKLAFDGFADEALVFLVGNGNGRIVRLGFGGDAPGSQALGILAGLEGDAPGKFQFLRVVHD